MTYANFIAGLRAFTVNDAAAGHGWYARGQGCGGEMGGREGDEEGSSGAFHDAWGLGVVKLVQIDYGTIVDGRMKAFVA